MNFPSVYLVLLVLGKKDVDLSATYPRGPGGSVHLQSDCHLAQQIFVRDLQRGAFLVVLVSWGAGQWLL